MGRNQKSNKNFLGQNNGYTIVEVLIFLAITSAMFVMAMLFLNGQQQKNEFNTGIRDIQSQLVDIMNDTSTGFYASSGQYSCDIVGGKPQITPDPGAELGSNASCMFLGRMLQFEAEDSIDVYSLVGRRRANNADVRTLAEASPVLLTHDISSLRLPYGIKIKKATYVSSGVDTEIGGVAITSRFSGAAGSGGIAGSQDVDLIPLLSGIGSLVDPTLVESEIITNTRNPQSGILLCFDSGGTNQHGQILLGGEGKQVTTFLTVENGSCI